MIFPEHTTHYQVISSFFQPYLVGRDHTSLRSSGLVPWQQIKGYLFPAAQCHSVGCIQPTKHKSGILIIFIYNSGQFQQNDTLQSRFPQIPAHAETTNPWTTSCHTIKQQSLSIRAHCSLNKVPSSRLIHHFLQYLFGRDHAQLRCSGLAPQQKIKRYLFPAAVQYHSGGHIPLTKHKSGILIISIYDSGRFLQHKNLESRCPQVPAHTETTNP